MTDEPYRWLEAIANRREYIRDQLKGASPVFAFSRREGVVVVGVGTGQSKVFEIYDRHALGALGHPVDIEKIRQSLIEAAHLEGFTRAPEDVTVRRMLNFALGPALKNAFEQVLAAPLIVEGLLVEAGPEPSSDVLAAFRHDGTHAFATGVAVSFPNADRAAAAAAWLKSQLSETTALREVVRAAVTASRTLAADGAGRADAPFPERPDAAIERPDGRVVEAAVLERAGVGRARYRALDGGDYAG
ncbi:MAG TPA: hypothetical protein VGL42_07560 [Opitutaceae bacterium]|jgi:proteasome alpha subunit